MMIILSEKYSYELSDEQLEAADVDKNGVVNANDASKILSYYSEVST